MGLPQLVGLRCACCGRGIPSITEGLVCPECGNPVHLKCQRPDPVTIPDTFCAVCGGDPDRAVARAVRDALIADARAGDRRVACPNCGSTHGFRSYRPEGMTAGMTPTGRATLAAGILLFLLYDVYVPGQLQCCKCEYVFRPRSRLRDIGCAVGIVLFVAGLVAWAVYQSRP